MRSAPWILAALAPLLPLVLPVAMVGCDRDRETTAAAPTSVTETPAPTSNAPVSVPPSGPAVDVAPPRAPALAVGDRLAPVTSRAADGTVGCGACRLGKAPRLLVIGSTDALARAEIWRNLDAMSRLYADNGLVALALVVAHTGGAATPIADAAMAETAIALVRKRSRIAMPAEIATDTAALAGITDDPTVVLVDDGDTVRFVGGAGPHWRELDHAIGSLLAAP